MDFSEIWNNILNFLQTGGLALLNSVLIFIIGLVLIKIILSVLRKSFGKSNMQKITQSFILSSIRVLLLVVLVLIVLKALGVDTSGLVALVAAGGVAVGLALKDSMSNLASGIILICSKPFKEGDYISVNGVEGIVKSIRMLQTKLLTYDNKLVILPNSTLINNSLTNYSARSLRRVDIEFSVDYATDIDKLKKIVLDVLKANGKILLEPAPFVGIDGFESSNIKIKTKSWVQTKDYWDVYYYIYDTVYNEFKRNAINIAYDQVEVRMRTDEVVMPYRTAQLPERVEMEKPKIDDDDLAMIDIDLNKLAPKDFKLKRKKKNNQKSESKN